MRASRGASRASLLPVLSRVRAGQQRFWERLSPLGSGSGAAVGSCAQLGLRWKLGAIQEKGTRFLVLSGAPPPPWYRWGARPRPRSQARIRLTDLQRRPHRLPLPLLGLPDRGRHLRGGRGEAGGPGLGV